MREYYFSWSWDRINLRQSARDSPPKSSISLATSADSTKPSTFSYSCLESTSPLNFSYRVFRQSSILERRRRQSSIGLIRRMGLVGGRVGRRPSPFTTPTSPIPCRTKPSSQPHTSRCRMSPRAGIATTARAVRSLWMIGEMSQLLSSLERKVQISCMKVEVERFSSLIKGRSIRFKILWSFSSLLRKIKCWSHVS